MAGRAEKLILREIPLNRSGLNYLLMNSRLLSKLLLISTISFIASSTTIGIGNEKVIKPKSGRALLFNMKVVLEQGLLVPLEFYTDANLEHFFGTPRIDWLLNTELELLVRMYGLDFVPVRDNADSSIGVNRSLIDDQNRLSPTGKIYAGVGVLCSCKLRIRDVEAVFGTLERTVTEKPMIMGGGQNPLPAPGPARDPMGNKLVTYAIRTPASYLSTISFSFDQDGNVNEIDAKQRTP